MKRTRFLILLAVITVVFTLQVLPAYAMTWQPIYEGVDYAEAYKDTPRLMRAFALRIDLQNPNVSFFATPSNGGSPYETNMQSPPTFRSAYGLEAAVNANYTVLHSPYAEVDGLLISNGTTVSLDQPLRQAQLRITSSKVASIVGTGGNPSGIHTAVAGDAYHLVGGVALGDNSWTAPRTSVGISQDGRYLIWCVVDGRQPGWSDGATILDMSYWMIDFGAWDAINLDGGGSSCLCTASGGVLNRPSDGSPRSVGANLGVNTIALPGPTEIVMDNPQGTCSANWATSTSSSQKYGADYRWRSTAAVSDSFTWTPNITTAGNYEVYAWWPAADNRSPAAPYLINYNGGGANVKVNQQTLGGQWNSLGIYNFAAGTTGNVKLSCWAPSGYVVCADAVKFVKR